ncbi:TorF family putative porin [Pseudoalteromonas denitrificans]|uniref:Nucleoside-specific outer membrane channel protein Tsx n=1 Tax=Pseudoalteromonas denitrificans DSM 6059 TaxID=1123010 RepID=A0A1I1PHQ8_9GAMM|nr:TorF family putative porin [Pseudoalteromonas denitrificans]SFD09337.1 conserved hypothetical protein [Pseudoalteromonas denitrificans DSM 6059]
MSSLVKLICGISLFVSSLYAVASDDDELLNGSFSGSIKIATDYVFRGESEVADGEIPAIQASFTWTHNSGFYTGLFGSTNKFESTPDIYAVIGPYIGQSGELSTSGINYNVFVFHYMYPGADNLDYTELWIKASKKLGDITYEFEITPTLNDWFGVKGWDGINYAFHPSITLNNDINLSGSIGYQELNGQGAEGWTHWNMGISKAFYGITLDLRYHDTNVDSSHKVYGSEQGLKIFDERVVFSISKSF